MKTLRVLGWDDPRGRDPLLSAAEQFHRRHPQVNVEVSTRPLAAFESQPIEEVLATHDVLCIDHPFIGEAAAREAFVSLEDYVDATALEAHRLDAIGPSFESYRWAGRQWAFAMDVACQVSARRDDILRDVDRARPESLTAVLDLARSEPGLVALALNPTHASCTFISLCAGATGGRAQETGFRVPRDVGIWAIEWLQELTRYAHPMSATSDPIGILEKMSGARSTIAYSPFIFGYSNYARPGYRARKVTFGDILGANGGHGGSILGGVGLAVSARSANQEEAVAFAAYVASPDFQCSELVAAGGQPASRGAWDDADLDRRRGGFFSGTRETTDASFVRPRFDGFHARQRSLGSVLHGLVWGGGSASAAVDPILDELILHSQAAT